MSERLRAVVDIQPERVAAGGLLLLQLAWILILPPFAGIDEFDHVYRAAGVAHGQVLAPAETATRGTGAWLEVPNHIVAAARDECESLKYTTPADCRPSAREGNMVTVASGAGRYNPVYYAAVGWPSIFLEGDAAVLAMRLLTAAASTALFWGALTTLRMGFRAFWPLVGATIAMSPMVVYSTSIVAPNGVEIMAATAVWASLNAGLRHPSLFQRGVTVWVLGLSAALLATSRQLGPLWLGLIIAFSVGSLPRGLARARMSLREKRIKVVAATTAVVTVGGAYWTVANRSLVVGVEDVDATTSEIIARLPTAVALWVFQSVAAFPMRNERAPGVVYFCFLALWIVMLLVALRQGARRESISAWTVGVSSLLIAAIITVRTYNQFGLAWQGRYALPLTVGTGVLAGLALARTEFGRPRGWQIGVGALAFALGHAVSTVSVALRQVDDSGSAVVSEYATIGTVALMCLLGASAMAWAATSASRAAMTERGRVSQTEARRI